MDARRGEAAKTAFVTPTAEAHMEAPPEAKPLTTAPQGKVPAQAPLSAPTEAQMGAGHWWTCPLTRPFGSILNLVGDGGLNKMRVK